VLARLPQADGKPKVRPALVLRQVPPYGDLLVFGVSSQLHQAVAGFDELMQPEDEDFATSGLRVTSVLRLAYLLTLPRHQVEGTLGSVAAERHRRILQRLSAFLAPR